MHLLGFAHKIVVIIPKMCGIAAISLGAERPLAGELVDALQSLQHRGQDSCGIALLDRSNRTVLRKGRGLVSDVFKTYKPLSVASDIGIGHGNWQAHVWALQMLIEN